MGAQTVAKTPIRRNNTLIVRLESCEYALANKPLSEGVLNNVDHQIVNTGFFTCVFHNNIVIGYRANI